MACGCTACGCMACGCMACDCMAGAAWRVAAWRVAAWHAAASRVAAWPGLWIPPASSVPCMHEPPRAMHGVRRQASASKALKTHSLAHASARMLACGAGGHCGYSNQRTSRTSAMGAGLELLRNSAVNAMRGARSSCVAVIPRLLLACTAPAVDRAGVGKRQG